MKIEGRPLPQHDEITAPFWEACSQGRLCFQSCRSCGYKWLPASVVCPRCWSGETEWEEASGRGKVFSFAVYRRSYHRAFKPPYIVAVIELSEGPRLVSNVIGVPPEEVAIGTAVKLEFAAAWPLALPVFRPSKEEG